MQIGVIFPQTEIGSDPGAVRELAQAAEEMGFSYIYVADHVLGADPSHHQHRSYQFYNHQSVVHEQLTLLAYIAALTERVGLVTGILILPQRQTALVAKQAAELDVLSNGRLRLGVGVGWNPVEYEALGENFRNRGARYEEQIEVLRAMWTHEVVDFHGKWHHISHAGVNPLPVQRPIPIWLGAGSASGSTPPEVVLRRIARLADGWCPNFRPDAGGHNVVDKVKAYCIDAGRDPGDLGLEGRLYLANKHPEDWLEEAKDWEELGASYLCLETRRGGITTVDGHIDAIRRFKEARPD